MRFLVVDDSRVMQRLVADVLSETGAALSFAGDGEEALAALARGPVDLIVSDVEMPRLGGVELARQVRARGVAPPILLMSAGDAVAGRAAVEAGLADAFLQKPFDPAALRRAVAAVLPRSFASSPPRRRIRVLVADDTEVGRRLLSRTLSVDPTFEVVAVAGDGAAAVEAAERLRPQLVLLDAFLPGLDGIQTTAEIMERAPAPVVLLTPDLASRAADVAFEATRAGAVDWAVPPPFGEVDGPAGAAFRERLKELAEVPVIGRRGPITRERAAPRLPEATGLVAVCSSTGGPAVLVQLLQGLAHLPDRPPILIVQHMLKGFGATFASWLSSAAGLEVHLPEADAEFARGDVLLSPDDLHLVVRTRGIAGVEGGAAIGAHRPSGTRLFESAARVYGRGLCAVLLTGMGEDGVAGLGRVRDEGGTVLVQSPATCVVPGMPEAAIRAGLHHAVLSPEDLVRALSTAARPQPGASP